MTVCFAPNQCWKMKKRVNLTKKGVTENMKARAEKQDNLKVAVGLAVHVQCISQLYIPQNTLTGKEKTPKKVKMMVHTPWVQP